MISFLIAHQPKDDEQVLIKIKKQKTPNVESLGLAPTSDFAFGVCFILSQL